MLRRLSVQCCDVNLCLVHTVNRENARERTKNKTNTGKHLFSYFFLRHTHKLFFKLQQLSAVRDD